MQKGKYVFVARSNGSFKHCRYRNWQRFLLGECVLGQPQNTSLISIELEIIHANVKNANVHARVHRRHTTLDSQGFYLSSELIRLSEDQLDRHDIDFSMQLTAEAFLIDKCAAAPTEPALCLNAEIVADYIQDLLLAEQSVAPKRQARWEQTDAFTPTQAAPAVYKHRKYA